MTQIQFKDFLYAELDWFKARGRCISFWWRDDDCIRVTTALRRLLHIQERHSTPLALAVVPYAFHQETIEQQSKLIDCLRQHKGVNVFGHGFSHRPTVMEQTSLTQINRLGRVVEPVKAEFGSLCELATGLQMIAQGFEIMRGSFNGLFMPVFVPPWNRLDPKFWRSMSKCGYKALSSYAFTKKFSPEQVQTHLDIIHWRGDKEFCGYDALIHQLGLQFARRRAGSDEPIGILSHHLVQDDRGFEFLDFFIECCHHHCAANFPQLDVLFQLNPTAPAN
ncbi:DUF2334 domain-containing protein [Polycladidibacter stylochi]|uniref:DUF2334 domain-containing protein n=1 Tax=Polycladidibacter stylochi TaxID=1807766 RepID=UPI0008330394|nr:DUF2334 domain-containing protein [Pseudovibrio stylochi]